MAGRHACAPLAPARAPRTTDADQKQRDAFGPERSQITTVCLPRRGGCNTTNQKRPNQPTVQPTGNRQALESLLRRELVRTNVLLWCGGTMLPPEVVPEVRLKRLLLGPH
jgi:hypothetical protein